MPWATIDTAGKLRIMPGHPTEEAIRSELPPDMPAGLYPTEYAVWLIAGADALASGLQPNVVAGTIGLLLSGPWVPLAGPVAVVGRVGPHADERCAALDEPSMNGLLNMYADVIRVLDIPAGSSGPVGAGVPADEIRRAAEFQRTADVSWA